MVVNYDIKFVTRKFFFFILQNVQAFHRNELLTLAIAFFFSNLFDGILHAKKLVTFYVKKIYQIVTDTISRKLR